MSIYSTRSRFPLPAGTIVVIDRAYLHFARLYALHQRQVTFVIRTKHNLCFTWIASREVDKATGFSHRIVTG